MNVLHLTTFPYGGAGISCLRLHDALRAEGVNSKILSLHGRTNAAEGLFSVEESIDDFSSTLKKALRKRYVHAWQVRLQGKPKELFSFPDSPWKIEDHPLVREADIIHLHWVAGMIDVKRFFNSIKKPIVWTMHDAWPFSGGFHYESYFDTTPFEKISKANLEIKRKAYAGKNITLVSPSNYLAELCKKSDVFANGKILIIPYGIQSSIYHPKKNRIALRKEIEISENQQLWFFACDELDYFRKGADLLCDAFSSWKNENVRLVIAGHAGKFSFPDDKRILPIGRVNDQNAMADLLNASDLLIHTSREDNLPNLILESLFCGTPVLSTPCGGMPELINQGINGLLTTDASVQAIKESFGKINTQNFDRAKISSEAQLKFAPDLQAKKYMDLYKTI